MTNISGRIEFVTYIKSVFSLSEASDIEMMYLLAKQFSKGQFRKELGDDGKPLRYFEHPKRVAISLVNYGCADADVICAALAHDLIEDAESKDLINMLLEKAFHKMPNLHQYVQILTKIPKVGYLDKLQDASENGSPAILIKMADRLDNLKSLPKDTEFVKKQVEETYGKMFRVFTAFIASSKTNQKHKKIAMTILADISDVLKNIEEAK